MELVSKLDEWGKGAWILLMIGGFVVFWPIGLAVLAYMIWSGRMSFDNDYRGSDPREDWRAQKDEWRARKKEMRAMKHAMRDDIRARCRGWRDEMRAHWHGRHGAMYPSGNAAFDEYKAETLKRLEEEQAEFAEFLDNLRKSRDKAEFDQFMQSRRNTPPTDENGEHNGNRDDNGPVGA